MVITCIVAEYGSIEYKVANPARGQRNREKEYSPVPCTPLEIWSRETDSSFTSRVSLLILHTRAESGAYSRDSSRCPRRRPFIYLNRHTPLGQSRVYRVYRWRSLPRVRRHRASSPQGSSSNGCCHFSGHHGPINVRLSFPTRTNCMKWAC